MYSEGVWKAASAAGSSIFLEAPTWEPLTSAGLTPHFNYFAAV